MSEKLPKDLPPQLRLEIAAVRGMDPGVLKLELVSRVAGVRRRRSELHDAGLELARLVDRAAAVHGEAWTLEALGLTEDELLALVSIPELS